MRYLDDVFPLADTANTQHREGVLNELLGLFRQWVRQVCVTKGAFRDLEAAADAGGAMFVSGSFKLGVNGVCDQPADAQSMPASQLHSLPLRSLTATST